MRRTATARPFQYALAPTPPAPTPSSATFIVVIPGLRLKNPNNGATGNTKLAAVIRSRERARVRGIVRMAVEAKVRAYGFDARFRAGGVKIRVTLLRIGPGTLDAWDNLPASLKPCVDAVADAFGVRDDDARFEWVPPKQEKRGRGVYGVEITIEAVGDPRTMRLDQLAEEVLP